MVNPAVPRTQYLAPGDKLGKYELIRQIAVGGMAELYLARTVIEGFEKLVVVKRILPQYMDNASFVGMFLNEARLAATLHHPNIAQVYDIGQEHGDYFFSMEYVHGEDLGQLVASATENGVPLSLDAALTLASGLCAGLHYAHEKASPDGQPLDVVHRDVSPSNVLISYDGGVKLVDFGIAAPSATRGGLKGKIGYMSPEQCRGKAAIDRRSDLFSIGTILYELTTGQLPFTDETEYGILDQIVNRDADPPSKLVPGYPPALEAIVMRALARDPDRRFASALELQHKLEGFAHDSRLRVSPLVLARLMSTLFPQRLEEWARARAQGAFFVEQHVVRTLIESGKAADAGQLAALPVVDDELTAIAQPPDPATEPMTLPTTVPVEDRSTDLGMPAFPAAKRTSQPRTATAEPPARTSSPRIPTSEPGAVRTSSPRIPTPEPTARPSSPRIAGPEPGAPRTSSPRPPTPEPGAPRTSSPRLPTPEPGALRTSSPRLPTHEPAQSSPRLPTHEPAQSSPTIVTQPAPHASSPPIPTHEPVPRLSPPKIAAHEPAPRPSPPKIAAHEPAPRPSPPKIAAHEPAPRPSSPAIGAHESDPLRPAREPEASRTSSPRIPTPEPGAMRASRSSPIRESEAARLSPRGETPERRALRSSQPQIPTTPDAGVRTAQPPDAPRSAQPRMGTLPHGAHSRPAAALPLPDSAQPTTSHAPVAGSSRMPTLPGTLPPTPPPSQPDSPVLFPRATMPVPSIPDEIPIIESSGPQPSLLDALVASAATPPRGIAVHDVGDVTEQVRVRSRRTATMLTPIRRQRRTMVVTLVASIAVAATAVVYVAVTRARSGHAARNSELTVAEPIAPANAATAPSSEPGAAPPPSSEPPSTAPAASPPSGPASEPPASDPAATPPSPSVPASGQPASEPPGTPATQPPAADPAASAAGPPVAAEPGGPAAEPAPAAAAPPTKTKPRKSTRSSKIGKPDSKRPPRARSRAKLDPRKPPPAAASAPAEPKPEPKDNSWSSDSPFMPVRPDTP